MTLDDASRERRLLDALGRYYDDAGPGPEPDRAAWVAGNPDLADDIEAFFAGQDRLARAVGRPEAPAKDFGDYEILREIARGGMGVVFEARQRSLNRIVALKMILAGRIASRDDLRRFQVEAEAVAGLDHPNIVPIYEVGEHNGRPYFSMKLMGGVTLADKVGDFVDDPRATVEVVSIIAGAVHHAHQRGVLHRDLKPSNILMDAGGRPHLADFGLARRTTGEDPVTRTGALIGSPPYMSPEQTFGREGASSTATDIYGLGALLYVLFTGRPPFRGESALETIEHVRTLAPDAPSKINRKVNRDLETICLKCLEKDPSRRYASASDLADDLGRWLGGEPIAARPVGRRERGLRWCRRNPTVAVLGAAVFMVAALGLSGVFWQWRAAVRSANAVNLANVSLKDALKKARFNAYIANIHLADREWDDSSVDRARDLLDDPATLEFRSFEWHYLDRKFHPELVAMRGHAQAVPRAVYSPDGRRIASASLDGTVKLWDAETGDEIATFVGHSRRIYDVAFRPDGRRIASASEDGTIQVWDIASNKEILTLRGHSDEVHGVDYSPDGLRIVSASSDRTAKVWDAETGRGFLTFRGHADLVLDASFSPDGRLVASASRDRTVRVWDAATGAETLTLGGHPGDVRVAAFSADGRRIFSACQEGTVKLWDARSGAELLTLRHDARLSSSAAVSPDGRLIAVEGKGGVTVYDANTRRPTFQIRGPIHCVSFRPDGRRIVCGRGGPTDRDRYALTVWDANESPGTLTLKGHTAVVSGLAFSPDGRLIVSGSWDKTVRIWDAGSGSEIRALTGHQKPIAAVAWSPDGEAIASADSGGVLRSWDARTGEPGPVLPGHATSHPALAYSPDARLLAAAGAGGTVEIREAKTGRRIVALKGHAAMIYGLAFRPDGRRIASAGNDGTIRIWDVWTGAEVRRFSDPDVPQGGVAFSPDGRLLASGSRHRANVKVRDADSGRILWLLRSGDSSFSDPAFTPDGRRVVAQSAGRGLSVWDVESGQEVLSTRDHEPLSFYLALSPDGHRVATFGPEAIIRVRESSGRP